MTARGSSLDRHCSKPGTHLQDTISDRPRPRRKEEEKKISLPLLIRRRGRFPEAWLRWWS